MYFKSLFWCALLVLASTTGVAADEGGLRHEENDRELAACEQICIDFSRAGNGTTLNHGDYVKSEWFNTFGMTVEASTTMGGYTPDGMARIYDTTQQGADPDLGSPNEKCGGHGVGAGGEPEGAGPNCNPEGEGNVLIIQESEKDQPDGSVQGGMMKFSFECPIYKLRSIGLLDVDAGEQTFFEIYKAGGGAPKIQKFSGRGSNSIQNERFDGGRVKNITDVTLVASNSFGIRSICFCPDHSNCPIGAFRIGPPPPPPLEPDPPGIVGGEPTEIGKFPFFVDWGGCGGSLIHEDIVLSAEHCPMHDIAYVGAWKIHSEEGIAQKREIEQRVPHPDPTRHDVVVLKLKDPSTLDTIPLNDLSDQPIDGEVLLAMGHGATESGPSSKYLLKVDLPAISDDDCSAIYPFNFIPGGELCAGYPEGGKDTCQGDSGGPLLETRDGAYVQVGITSWGEGCARPDKPGVYARVSGVKDWIDDQVCKLASNPPSRCHKKKKMTWSIRTFYDANSEFDTIFPPKGTDILAIPVAAGLLVDTIPWPFDIKDEAFIEVVRVTLAQWQTAIEIDFEQVESDGDIEIQIVGDRGGSNHEEESLAIPSSHGGRIELNLFLGRVEEKRFIDWSSDMNKGLVHMRHELGRVLGLAETLVDKGDYIPKPLFNYAVMDNKWVLPDGRMRQYFNDVDISHAVNIWGPSKYHPLISLRIPNWNNTVYYTNSWDEANSLVKGGVAFDVMWMDGALSKTNASDRRPLYRSYNGIEKYIYYTEDTPVDSGLAFASGGVLGYLWKEKKKNMSPLYRYYWPGLNQYVLRSEGFPGLEDETLLGYVIEIDAMVGYASEKVDV